MDVPRLTGGGGGVCRNKPETRMVAGVCVVSGRVGARRKDVFYVIVTSMICLKVFM